MLKLLVFDLDGTLVDTRRDLGNSVNHALTGAGFPALPMEAVMAAVGDGARNLISRCLTAAQEGKPASQQTIDEVLAGFLIHYNENCLVESTVYPGVAAALEKLAGYRMAVLTNKPVEPARRILAGLDLARHFEWVLGGDNPFGQKPDPAALNHLVANGGAEPRQTAMIGDGIQDLRAAERAGTRFLGFLNGIGNRQTLLSGRPEATLENMRDLPAAIASLEASA